MYVQYLAYRRPDQPQPVYPRVVDAVVAKWIPAFDAAMGCVRTGDCADLDPRLSEWDAEFTWVQPVVDRTVRTWMPIFDTELACVRTGDRGDLDVRTEWDAEFTWVWPVVDRIVATWGPAINGPEGDRTHDGSRVDVRDWLAPPAWVLSSLPATSTTAQQWPALLQALGISYRSGDRPSVDVRRIDVPNAGWPQSVVDRTVATWMSAIDAEVGVRTPDRPAIDVRLPEWAPQFGWVQPVVDSVVSAWTPNWTLGRTGERSPDGSRLDPRRPEWSPSFTWVAPVVDAQVSVWGPALRTGGALSVRTPDGPRLDVRAAQWDPSLAWIESIVERIISTWGPAFRTGSLSDRTLDRARLELRTIDWLPSVAWIFANLPVTVTQAQLWPAILASLGLLYRMGDRPALDVRRPPWAPDFGWVEPVVERTVSTWTPAFRTGALSERTIDRARLELRLADWLPSLAWIVQNLPPAVTQAQIWPAILQALGLSYRSDARAALDVRNVQSPVFGWPQPVVDRIVASWGPIFAAELTSERSREKPLLDVRRPEWSPEFGWVTKRIDVVVSAWAPVFDAERSTRITERRTVDVRDSSWSPERAWRDDSSQIDHEPPVLAAPTEFFLVSAQGRTFSVTVESRLVTVPIAGRFAIDAQGRFVIVPEDDHEVDV